MNDLAPKVRAALARAYETAALAGLDGRTAADFLERARAAASGDLIPALTPMLNCLVAEAIGVEPLARILAEFRDVVKAAVLRAAAEQAKHGSDWRNAVGAALDTWQPELAVDIARLAPVSSEQEATAKGVEAVLHGRWREAAPVYDQLGHDPSVEAVTRSHLLALRAVIDVRVFRDAEAACRRVDEAEALVSDQWMTCYARAVLLGMPETPQSEREAEAEYKRADRIAKGRASGPLSALGLLMKKRGNLVRAEQCFLQAAKAEDTPSEEMMPDRPCRSPLVVR